MPETCRQDSDWQLRGRVTRILRPSRSNAIELPPCAALPAIKMAAAARNMVFIG